MQHILPYFYLTLVLVAIELWLKVPQPKNKIGLFFWRLFHNNYLTFSIGCVVFVYAVTNLINGVNIDWSRAFVLFNTRVIYLSYRAIRGTLLQQLCHTFNWLLRRNKLLDGR